jgi:hypothetical protein
MWPGGRPTSADWPTSSASTSSTPEHWIAAWEREGERLGLERHSQAFWEAEFPTADDDSLGMSESSTALPVSWDDSGPEPPGPVLMLLGLSGLLVACAVYPIVAAWVLFGILGGGKSPGLWAPTVGVAAGMSLLVALLVQPCDSRTGCRHPDRGDAAAGEAGHRPDRWYLGRLVMVAVLL